MIPNKALICPTSMYPYVNVIIYLGQVRTSEEDFSLPPVPFLNLSSAHMSDGLGQANVQHNWSSQ